MVEYVLIIFIHFIYKTILHTECKYGNLEIVRELIEYHEFEENIKETGKIIFCYWMFMLINSLYFTYYIIYNV